MLVDIYNDTETPERIHWHGQNVAAEVASDVPAYSRLRMEFTPTRAGLYFYHSSLIAAARLDCGLYSGQVGALLVEPAHPTRRPEREYVVVLQGHEPYLCRTSRGCEVGDQWVTINGRLLSHCDPLLAGSVLLHVLNASATTPYSLELPGHSFEVLALDGNAVPSPARAPALCLSPGERITARLAINEPARWLVQAAGSEVWDYTRYGSGGRPPEPDVNLDLVLTRHAAARSGLNRWSINGACFAAHRPAPLFRLQHGLRYRLKISNTSDEIIPLHLQHHRLHVVKIGRTATTGIMKDVVTVGPWQQLEVDFVADNPGPALLYCTRQLHKDFGLMALLDYT
jgi:FtsP/CotA-like multicopper oxidase with cupredoxin domain